MRTKNVDHTLSYTFWNVLAEKHPELVKAVDFSALLRTTGLGAVYNYEYEVVKSTNF